MATKPQMMRGPGGLPAKPTLAKSAVAKTDAVRARKPRVGPLEFLAQVRAEGEKVTWPSRKETLITAAMVFVMVVLASLFFLVTDFVLQKIVGLVLGIGG